MDYAGSKKPLVTVVMDSISMSEDERARTGTGGAAKIMAKVIRNAARDVGFDFSRIRWAPISRCARGKRALSSIERAARLCRHHLAIDLMQHRPSMIMTVGYIPLKSLLHKRGSTSDWEGKVLTYRGWPDDLLVRPVYAQKHPFLGPRPNIEIPLYPIASPQAIFATDNLVLIHQWQKRIAIGLRAAKDGIVLESEASAPGRETEAT